MDYLRELKCNKCTIAFRWVRMKGTCVFHIQLVSNLSQIIGREGPGGDLVAPFLLRS